MKKSYLILSFFAAALIGVGCGSSETEPANDCNNSSLLANLVTKSDAHCSQSDASFEVQGNGGKAPYQYSIDGTTFQSSGQFGNIAAGNYTVRVKDADDCVSTLQVNVLNQDGVNMTTSVTDSGCGTSQGQIVVNASGGATPYTYSINGGDFVSSNTFSQLASGDYTIRTKDATNCEISQSVSISTGISFSNSVAQIISNNCATSSCHGGTQSPDLRNFSNIQAFASQIKTLTGNGTMPKEGTLSNEQIAAIACWVDDGAKDN